MVPFFFIQIDMLLSYLSSFVFFSYFILLHFLPSFFSFPFGLSHVLILVSISPYISSWKGSSVLVRFWGEMIEEKTSLSENESDLDLRRQFLPEKMGENNLGLIDTKWMDLLFFSSLPPPYHLSLHKQWVDSYTNNNNFPLISSLDSFTDRLIHCRTLLRPSVVIWELYPLRKIRSHSQSN